MHAGIQRNYVHALYFLDLLLHNSEVVVLYFTLPLHTILEADIIHFTSLQLLSNSSDLLLSRLHAALELNWYILELYTQSDKNSNSCRKNTDYQTK